MRKFLFLPFVCLFLALSLEAAPRLGDISDLIRIYRQRQADSTPESVLRWLKEGNARFVAGRSSHGGYPVDSRERVLVSASGQRPVAAVLSCVDSRTTPELAFDTSVGDLFTARVGANVISNDILGSLEVAVESGAKVVVILGHTQCGGIMAACNNVELGHLTQLLAKVRPAIHSVHDRMDRDQDFAREVGERLTSNRRYVAEVSHANAKQSLAQVLERSSLLREKSESGEVAIVSAMFDVYSGRVTFDP
jgi:carbonic anhydrase